MEKVLAALARDATRARRGVSVGRPIPFPPLLCQPHAETLVQRAEDIIGRPRGLRAVPPLPAGRGGALRLPPRPAGPPAVPLLPARVLLIVGRCQGGVRRGDLLGLQHLGPVFLPAVRLGAGGGMPAVAS